MADRYWVGGTGSWAATTTNWSATNGGPSGASVPTLNDDVFFTSLSNSIAYTVTLTTAPVCRSVTISGPLAGNVTIAGTAAWSIYGSMTIAATGVTRTTTSAITFAATTTGFTVTTNGVVLDNAITFNGVGGAWSLGSALTTGSTRTVTLTNGTLDLANNTLTCGFFSSSNSNTRTIAFGAGQINLTGNNGSIWASGTLTNLTITGTPIVNATYSGATGTRTMGIGALSESQAITFNITAGTDIVVCTGNFKDLIFTGFAGSITNTTRSIYGNLTLDAGMTFVAGASITSIAGTSGTQLITSNGVTVNNQITFNGAGGTFRLQDALTVASTRSVLLTAGTLELNDKNITCGAFSTSNTNTRTLAFGTGQIYLTGNAATVWTFNNATSLTITGSAVVNATYSGSTGTRSISGYGATGTVLINLNVTAGSDIVALSNSGYNNINFTGFTGQTSVTSTSVSGNYTLDAGMTVVYITGNLNFNGTSGTQLITTNGVTVDSQVTFNGIGGTFRLQDALTIGSTRAATLTNGALDLNNNNLTCGIFSSTNSNTRSIAFGTGQIYAVGNNNFNINFNIMTGFTYTGSGTLNATYSGGAGTRGLVFGNAGGGSESNALNINITAGTDLVQVYGAGIKSINFTGFAGTWIEAGSRTMYGDLTISTGMSVTATSATFFDASSGTKNITSNGKTITFSIFKRQNGTLALLDALTLEGTRTFVLNAGVFDLNGNDLTTGLFDSFTSAVRQLLIGSNTITVTGSTWSVYDSNFTITGAGIISMTSASAKTFIGSGYSYPTLNQGGSGSLLITGSNAFANITNTVQPATVTFESGTTTSVANFSLLGTAGNLITINSSLAGAQSTLNNTSGGPIVTDYLSIQDSNATPSNTMYAGRNSTNVSNNTGWIFAALFVVLVNESFTLTDAQTAQLLFTLSNDESLTLTDAESSQVDFASLNAESLTLTDEEASQTDFATTNAESLTLTDSETSQVDFVSLTEESLSLTDAQVAQLLFTLLIAESLTLTDEQSVQMDWSGVTAESLNSTDSVSAIAVYVPTVFETITFVDALIQRGWIKIDDNQTPVWGAINNNQTPTWGAINDDQTPGWADIDNYQG